MQIQIKKYNFGFSLIELLVVISIVGIIAAIALPAYRQYKVQSFAASAIPLIDNLFSKATIYSESHGTFPSAQDLSIKNPSAGSATEIDPSVFPNSFVAYIGPYVNPASVYTPTDNCGSQGEIVVYYFLNNSSSATRRILILDCYQWREASGTNNKFCSFKYTDNNFTNVPPFTMPGLVPQFLSTGDPNPDFVDLFTQYTNAVCS